MGLLRRVLRSQDTVWVSAVVAYFCIQYRAAILQGKHWLFGDNSFQNFPWHYFVWDRVRHGGLTEPCVSMGLGMPLFAEPQVQCFYPFNTAWWPIADPFLSFTLKMLLHMLAATVGMYALARQEGRSPMASAGAAIVVGGGSFMVYRLLHTPILCALAWLPWILLLFLRVLNTGSRVAFVGLAGCLAGQILTGHPQLFVYTVITCLILAPAYLRSEARAPRWRVGLWPLAVLAGAVAIGVVISTVQLLPSYELSLYGFRASGVRVAGPQFFRMWGCTLREVAVNFLGGMDMEMKWEKTGFPGTLPLVAALYCIIWVRERRVRLWAVLIIVGLLLSWTIDNPLYDILAYVPVFSRLRGHARLGLFVTLGCAMLLARLIDDVKSRSRRRLLLAALGALVGLEAVALAATGRIGLGPWIPHDPLGWQFPIWLVFAAVAAGANSHLLSVSWVRGALVLLTAAELLAFSQGVNPALTKEQWLADPDQRVFALAAERARADGSAFVRGGDAPTNVGICYGVRYPRAFSPLVSLPQEVTNVLLHDPTPPEILSAFGVKWLATPHDWQRRSGLWHVDSVGRWDLYENQLPAPEVYIPDRVVPGDINDQAVILRSGQVDPRRLLVAPAEIVAAGFHPGPDAEATVERSTVTELVVRTWTKAPALLVATRGWTPHWSTTVDGRPAFCFATNLILLTVAIPAGVHRVAFSYHLALTAPAAVSAVAVVAYLIWLAAAVAKSRGACKR